VELPVIGADHHRVAVVDTEPGGVIGGDEHRVPGGAGEGVALPHHHGVELLAPPGGEPDLDYFHRLRRIKLTEDNAYPLLRRAGRLIGAVEAEVTKGKVRAVRGSMLTSYLTFSGQVIAMTRALRDGRAAIRQDDISAGLRAVTALIETAPADLATGP